MELTEIRSNIDEIDSSIMKLLKERMDLMPPIAEYKKANGLDIFDPSRENKIIECKREMAKEFGLNEDLVEELFKKIMDESKEIQKRVLDRSQ
jgi:chorismate mutase/prephenate dehydrogenase